MRFDRGKDFITVFDKILSLFYTIVY